MKNTSTFDYTGSKTDIDGRREMQVVSDLRVRLYGVIVGNLNLQSLFNSVSDFQFGKCIQVNAEWNWYSTSEDVFSKEAM